MPCKTSWLPTSERQCQIDLRLLTWAKTFERSQLPQLEAPLSTALLSTSIHMAGAEHDITQHLMRHLVSGVADNGPPWATAMHIWSAERMRHKLIAQNHVTKHPHIGMMNNYKAEWLADAVAEKIAEAAGASPDGPNLQVWCVCVR